MTAPRVPPPPRIERMRSYFRVIRSAVLASPTGGGGSETLRLKCKRCKYAWSTKARGSTIGDISAEAELTLLDHVLSHAENTGATAAQGVAGG